MPPRIPGAQRLGNFSLCLRPAPKPSIAAPFLPITQTASLSAKEKRRIAKRDPYRFAQIKQRETAHAKRRAEIDAAHEAAQGDPIRGFTTPFIRSLDAAGQHSQSTPKIDDQGRPIEDVYDLPTSPDLLNHLLNRQEVESAIENAYTLTKPAENSIREGVDDGADDAHARHDAIHAKAVEAVKRITELENGSAKHRLHANIRRCVDTFGRHQTELTLRPRPLSRGQVQEEKPVRAGPDTGSSEVQIAILTAKIRALADALEKNRGYKDKMGNRDLRLLTHRRQKLLKYMERKERGSDRWKHMIETLGLGPATWKGQISF